MKQTILETIKKCYQEDGGISRRLYETKTYSIAPTTIRRHFGAWTTALEEAGIKPDEKPTDDETREQIIEALHRFNDEEDKLHREIFVKKSYGFSNNKIRKLFGSWTDALVEAGLKQKPEVESKKFEEEQKRKILSAIKRFIDEEEDDCSLQAFRSKEYSISHPTIQKYFGSWDHAFDMAKHGQALFSKGYLVSNYGIPENFVRGMQFIPELKDKLVFTGKNGRGSVYKIPEEHVDFVVQYHHNLQSEHDFYKKSQEWFTIDQCQLMIYCTDEIINEKIQNGSLERGKDFARLNRVDWKRVGVNEDHQEPSVLFLNKEAFVKFRYVTIGTMLKSFRKQGINTTFQTLTNLREQGLISKYASRAFEKETVEYFDQEKVLQTLTHYLSNTKKISNQLSSYDLLNQEQQQLIDTYIQARENGVVIEWNGYRAKRNMAHGELRLPEVRQRISNAFFSIICGRCGVNYQNGAIKLSDEELEGIDPDVFNVIDVTMDDYGYIAKNRKTNTLIQRYGDLRAFYYWLLMREDSEPKNTFEDYQAFESLRKSIHNFLNQFPKKRSDAPAKEKIESITKVFLTPKEIVQCRNAILNTFQSDYALKYAAIWTLCATTGLRPEELIHLKIDHFVLDEEGLIASNQYGYGELIVDRTVGKGEYSLSHPDYNLPIPKDAVEQINLYLKLLYKRQGEENEVGKGYFLRSHPMAAHKRLRTLDKGFVTRIREVADFLPKEKRENLILKSTRHSMHNIMKKASVDDRHLRDNVHQYAIYYQMRHKPEGLTIGEKHYLEDITQEEYYAILDATINFPWDLEELDAWQAGNGDIEEKLIASEQSFVEGDSNLSEQVDNQSHETTLDKKTAEELENVQEQLLKMKVRDKSMSTSEWLKKRKELQKREQLLKMKNTI